MASKYWLKLYHEILDDVKVCRLPDSSYRRFIECLLLAGELGEDGLLPEIEVMAWRLRIDEKTCQQDMSRLALAGIVHLDESNRWVVTKFAERQAPVSDKERMRRMRERQNKRTYYEPVTDDVTIRNRDIDIDIDIDIDKTRAHEVDGPNKNGDKTKEYASALAIVCKTPYGIGINEDKYEQAAQWCMGQGISLDDIGNFEHWWKANRHYPGKPALKSLLSEIQNAKDLAVADKEWWQ